MVFTTTQGAESTNTATEAVRPFVPRSTCQKSLLRPLETPGGKSVCCLLFATTLGLHYLHYELFEKEGLNVSLNSMIQFHKRLFLPKKREFFMPITEGRTIVQKTLERKKAFSS